MVEVSLTVGKLDASLALLLTKDHHLIEFPTLLLPSDVKAGSIVKIKCEHDAEEERRDQQEFRRIQDDILQSFGRSLPKAPALRIKNVTQTSVVLEWDPIDLATADLISLTLYKNNQRFGLIPTPLKRTATKLSGLSIDSEYQFRLVLSTTAGTFSSDTVTVKTHKMTDLTGITMCIGSLNGSDISEAEISDLADKIGAKPLQNSVKLDTTHFICTEEGDSPQYKKAQDWNIPIVRPEWVRACEAERRLVGVRAYYLNADPKLRPPVQNSGRPRTVSQTTSASSVRPQGTQDGSETVLQHDSSSSIPQLRVTQHDEKEKEEAKKSLEILPERQSPQPEGEPEGQPESKDQNVDTEKAEGEQAPEPQQTPVEESNEQKSTEPTEPTEPIEPTKPADTGPVESTEPAEPVESTEPTEPETAGTAVSEPTEKVTEPKEPSEPVEPAESKDAEQTDGQGPAEPIEEESTKITDSELAPAAEPKSESAEAEATGDADGEPAETPEPESNQVESEADSEKASPTASQSKKNKKKKKKNKSKAASDLQDVAL